MGLERVPEWYGLHPRKQEGWEPNLAGTDNRTEIWPSGERLPSMCEADLTENRRPWEHRSIGRVLSQNA